MIEKHKRGGKKPYKSKPGHKRPRGKKWFDESVFGMVEKVMHTRWVS